MKLVCGNTKFLNDSLSFWCLQVRFFGNLLFTIKFDLVQNIVFQSIFSEKQLAGGKYHFLFY